uniref:Uncharacterized protein n=1 Tax=Dictyostelium citrinum TaxID=361072 RepID=Q2LCS2_DICCI|nr:hypothetical protein [Dictyostelium citrinum]
MSEILKDLNINDRENEIGVAIPKGELIQVKVNKKEEILGKIIKHRGKYFALEIGRKKLKVQVMVPKRRELTIDLIKL